MVLRVREKLSISGTIVERRVQGVDVARGRRWRYDIRVCVHRRSGSSECSSGECGVLVRNGQHGRAGVRRECHERLQVLLLQELRGAARLW